MRSVFELIARHVEPSIKRQLVEALVSRGVPKLKIARCLGISPSLATRYSRRERGLHDFSVFSDVSEMVERLADRVMSGELCGVDAYYELAKITMYVLSKKYACSIHYSVDRTINPAKCSICLNLFKSLFT